LDLLVHGDVRHVHELAAQVAHSGSITVFDPGCLPWITSCAGRRGQCPDIGGLAIDHQSRCDRICGGFATSESLVRIRNHWTHVLETTMNDAQRQQMATGQGFIAALDQSGGSTPKALRLYGLDDTAYASEAEMFDEIHRMRTRIITSPAFSGSRIIGAILFEMTMDRQVEGVGTAEYLWNVKQVVPFLKVDKGLADEVDGAQVMKAIPDLDALLDRANGHGVFGTKMRSVIKLANAAGVGAVVDQQFEIGRQILAKGLVPIIEPEVDINSPDKQAAEGLLKDAILAQLAQLPADQQVMLKLTIPSQDDFYADLVAHPKVLRVVALSGGYAREDANARLARNHGVIASFSRALTEGLTAQQSDAEFNATLDAAVQGIYEASIT